MNGSVREVLFETRRHASGTYSNYPPSPQQPDQGGGRSLLSYLSPRGITHLKERWTEYRNPKRLGKYAALFVSPNAIRVAVAFRNQITFLQKDNGYQEPSGTFTSRSMGTFICGKWSEAHDVLGVVDDSNTLYFINANGEEITRIKGKHLKVSLSILCLILQDDNNMKKSCLCTFSILTSDGLFHDVEISQDPSASISAAPLSYTTAILKKQFPKNVFCIDHHPKLSLFATITSSSPPGLHSLSLWQRSSLSDLELVASIEFEGVYSEATGYTGWLTSSKVLISPQGNFIATLDIQGGLLVFKFNQEQCSFINCYDERKHNVQVKNDLPSGGMDLLEDIVDFAWWSDDILAVAKRDCTLTMFDVLTGVKLLENDPVFSMPLMETVENLSGCLFLLESTSSEQSYKSSERKGTRDSCLTEQLDGAKLHWDLFSLSERSVSEMYDLLINNQNYQAALSFADRHGLDKDEVLKSQWISSSQGVNEINKLLSTITDHVFVLSECVDRIGRTEDAQKALLAYGLRLTDSYRFSRSEEDKGSQVWDFRMARLKLLLFRDQLETFLGINMGRFSAQEYSKFRTSPINETAVALAETGKIGALNLLFKRHPYSLTPFMLQVLAAIPETVPVQTYAQLLPGNTPPSNIALREEDWVECDTMISFINKLPENHSGRILIRTEPIVKKYMGFHWPSTAVLSLWYKNRARDIDTLSGQLDNCLCLVDFACCKGISELQHFLEDISYLHQLIYSSDNEEIKNLSLSLIAWEQLSDYERFKLMLMGAREENIIERLHKIAIPFMRTRYTHTTANSTGELMSSQSTLDKSGDSFLVRWLKEISLENNLEICLRVIEEGCKDMENAYLFKDEAQVVDCALECIYLCSSTDRWSIMATILSKLPHFRAFENDCLKKKLKVAEGHVEAGRILTTYQVPKPINYFVEAHMDEKGVKQMLRLILSKFVRRQMGRSDNDWANMWRDLQSLQEKAFPFLDLEYVLIEFCRGLLKAGKFLLARNYLKGTGSIVLATEKAENLVIQAAREYFFSASSLDCPEIWKAKECLNIFPSSRNVRAEADIIDALTLRLPKLGVNILPLQFRQMKDPLEIIKLAITSQAGAYLNVDELIEIAKLLGLSSHDDVAAVQEAIAREAAVAGDLQLAFDLCLILAKKGRGSVWDLCAALARGPALENMDVNSRKHLLGFSLSHCDAESIGELLNAWKDLDMLGQCENLMMLSGSEPPESSAEGTFTISYPLCCTQGSADFGVWSGKVDNIGYCDPDVQLNGIKDMLSLVAKYVPMENGYHWESLLRENGKILSFSAFRLPWLLELTNKAESVKNHVLGWALGKQYVSVRTQAFLTILSWLARNDFVPRDDLIVSIAKSIMEPPVTEEEDIIGCSFLLNLVDAFSGVDVIEGFVKSRRNYNEITSIMNVGLVYGLLHNRRVECEDPAQRRVLLLREFQQKHKSVGSDERDELDKAQSAFWREWKIKLEEQKCAADHSRVLEQIIPGVETARFLSGDTDYIKNAVFSLIGSVKVEKKHILKDASKLAHTYGLDPTKVLHHYMSSILTSEVWTVDDIVADLSEFRKEIISSAAEAIEVITLSVYPFIDGHDKQRLAYTYDLLADCYLQLEEQKEKQPNISQDTMNLNTINLAHFSKIVSQECYRVSFIDGLNFKNIAGLKDLNRDCFNSEVCSHISENNVEALANLVRNLVGLYGDSVPEGLLSWQNVYRHHILNLLTALETRSKTEIYIESSENFYCFIGELEQSYNICLKYMKFIEYPGILDIMKRFFIVMVPFQKPSTKYFDSTWQKCLIKLLNMWLTLMSDVKEFKFLENSDRSFCSESLVTCLKVFLNLIIKREVSTVEGWGTVIGFSDSDLTGDTTIEVFNFCRAMVFAGCRFVVVANVFTDALSQTPGSELILNIGRCSINIQDLPHLYLSLLEDILPDLDNGYLKQQCFHNFLSSLSKFEGNVEDLNSVRHAVWKKMADVSDNLQLPSHTRVYILELMQQIAATGKHVKGFSSELEACALPWEGWENVQGAPINYEKTDVDGISSVADAANRFTNTLVALKSSQLLSAISPSLEVAPEDLFTVESAVSCFLKVSESTKSESHVDVLIAMLGEWEELFVSGRKGSPKIYDSGNNWSNDDWDEGWESFLEEPKEKEMKSNSMLSLHPLHLCWMEIFKKLISLSRYKDFLKMIDKYKGYTMQILLDENDAFCLSQIMLEFDCFVALKMALLLPYENVQLLCLEAVEEKLKRAGIPDELGQDYELLILILSSGSIAPIISRSSSGATLSCICYIFGNLSRQCQEAQLSSLKHMIASEDKSNLNLIFLFTRLLFPCFLAELVKANQQVLAGFLVTKFMHTNASLSLINVAEASLRRYFQKQLQWLDSDEASWEGINSSESLLNSISSLRENLGNLVRSALSILPTQNR